jgi:hypothetical protein
MDRRWTFVALIPFGVALFGCGAGESRGSTGPESCRESDLHGWDPCRNRYE